MKRANSYEKHIYCLEGNWNKNPRSNQSLKPILELLHTTSKTKYIHRKCNTKKEFIQGLLKFTQKRYANYTILYIAFHGRTNRICCGNEYITLNEIATVLEGKLEGKIIHFGSCSTLRTSQINIKDFIDRTNCTLISGYKRNVDYISSAAFELLYFDSLQKYCSYSKLKDSLTNHYSILVDKLQFHIE